MFIAVVQNSLVNFSAVKIDTTDIFIFAGIILAAICAIWGIRKMIALGYLSSVPGHWQKRYEREQDLVDYKEFRDEGGFERGTCLGFFGGKSWYYDKDVQVDSSEFVSGDTSDDDEFIGAIGDKSYYYDQRGEVYVTRSMWFDPINPDDEEPVDFDSYEQREAYREHVLDYIDNRQDFYSAEEYIEWREYVDYRIDDYRYVGDGRSDIGYAEEEEDLNIGWEK